MQIQPMALKDLRPNEKNPRSIKDGRFAELKRALSEDPEMLQARPVIALPDGTVIAGNMRLRAAEALGWEDIPTVVVELDAQRAQMWALRDNAAYGEWVEQDLAEMLFELGQEGADLGLTGLDEGELTKLLDSVGIQRGGNTDPDEVAEVPENPITEEGDEWILGEHRLLCGDSTQPEALSGLLRGEQPAMVWSDPPYGLGGYAGRSHKFEPVTGDASEWERLNQLFWVGEAAEVYVCCEFSTYIHLLETRGTPRSLIVWAKPHFGMGRGYRRQHEFIGYYGSYTGTTEADLWEEGREGTYRHPTQKPVALPIRAMRNSSQAGELVLDPYVGSGTSIIAAEQLGRRCYGVEIDPGYCDVAVQRWEEFTGQKAERA